LLVKKKTLKNQTKQSTSRKYLAIYQQVNDKTMQLNNFLMKNSTRHK